MSKKNKKKKRNGSANDPIQCTNCPLCRCNMKKVGKNHLRSRYTCTLTDNEVPLKPFILIPKWCPKGYQNLFD